MAPYLPILSLFLAVAAASDVAQRRIPNLVVAPLAVAGIAAQWVTGGAAAAASGLLAGCAVLVILGVFWARGALGGGDVKLAASAAVWLGLGSLVPFLLYSGAAGVPVALAAKLAHRLECRATATGTGALAAPAPRATAPVAVAVAIGALAAAWVKP